MKLVRPGLAGDARFRRRSAREVANARKVGGIYTAEVVNADPDADPPWLVTAYVPGPSLRTAVDGERPLPPEAIAPLGAALVEGPAAVHDAKVVHGDLTPGNVILAEDGPRLIRVAPERVSLTPDPLTTRAAHVQAGALIALIIACMFDAPPAAPAPAGREEPRPRGGPPGVPRHPRRHHAGEVPGAPAPEGGAPA
ncbi:MAG: hypothetical protein GEV11_16840, partial [Streptosporangiales bacterium]|nr:hypothetical protein [Streptosporangiales bacterium]